MSLPNELETYLDALKSSRRFGPQVVHHRTIPAREASYATDFKLSRSLLQGLRQHGISRLYHHQLQALDLIRQGHDLLVATPTASGKSLIYNIPVLERYFQDPASRALYLFPLKALARDQHRFIQELSAACVPRQHAETRSFAEIYDGDTNPYQRARIRRQPPPVLITNPDMLHLSILPFHQTWSSFLKNLNYIVIDEIHTYRGVFGSHVAWVLKRLQRLIEHYGGDPVYLMLSATIGNPREFGRALTGRVPEVLVESGAPTGTRHLLLLNPWDSAAYTAGQLLLAAMKRGLRTIVYTKSRKMTELIAIWIKPKLGSEADRLSAYRAGFLPQERRDIEARLASGALLGVISTSALELGIDIGNLDLCILVGYPGSIMATWQRAGRVGRKGRDSAMIFVAGEDALDQHFIRDPDDFFCRSPEHAVVNPDNQRIAAQHLPCAAAEEPLRDTEPLLAGDHRLVEIVTELTGRGVLYQDQTGTSWHAARKRPQRQVDLRGSGQQLSIINIDTGEIIGEIDSGRALKETHPGAVYLHHSASLLIDQLDLWGREVLARETRLPYYTRPTVQKHTEIITTETSRSMFGCILSWGRLRVTERITGYQKINHGTGRVITTLPLELPEQVIETEGLWLEIRESDRQRLEERQLHFMGAIHGLEHCLIAMFPLYILCDRNDLGGISCPHHEQTAGAAVFVYDGCDGGAGLSEAGFQLFENLISGVEQTIDSCPCATGCPSCVHSPKCGSGNRPIDKAASLSLVRLITSGPKQPPPISGRARGSSSVRGTAACAESDPGTQTPDAVAGFAALPDNYGVFDLETKYSAQEVGGWSRADRMGVSVGVVYDAKLDDYRTYLEPELEAMIDHLHRLELVVGFNNKRFDNRVLSAYTDKDLTLLPSLDLLEAVHDQLGYRLSLDRLAEHTLGTRKQADGLQALAWYRQGRIEELARYCREDVVITRDLFHHALQRGFLLFRNKSGAIVRLPLRLDRRIAEILSGKPVKARAEDRTSSRSSRWNA